MAPILRPALIVSTLFFALNSKAQKYIPMTFHNGSNSSIPLVIPGVMNPNLSPNSNSGVTLGVGQVVYFFPKGKKGTNKEILFVVPENWRKDTTLEIDQIIRQRKAELEKESR